MAACRNDPDQDFLGRVALECVTDRVVEEWKDFMVKHASFFEGTAQDEEFPLECTQIHQSFIQLVEGQLEGVLKVHEASAEEFFKVCSNLRLSGDEDQQLEVFLTLIHSVGDFAQFADIMRKAELREYYFWVLRQWKTSLSHK